jgi:hypothetical protein
MHYVARLPRLLRKMNTWPLNGSAPMIWPPWPPDRRTRRGIDRLAGEKDLCSRRQADHHNPRTADSTRRNAFSLTPLSTRTRTPSGRSISITPTRSANARPVLRGHTAPAVIGIAGLGSDASATTPSRTNSTRGNSLERAVQTSGLPCRSPIIQQALRDPVPPGNDRNPDRPRPPLRPSAPPFRPASSAGGAQPQSRHPLQALLLDSPEGHSFPHHAAVDHTRQAGSDRTLT